jgi:hypothetical protein
MTQDRWNSLPLPERERLRDNSDLRPELCGFEGWRVEVVDKDGKTRRFIVGKSTGWRPCHIEINRRSAFSGGPADSRGYLSVRGIERIR